ncbi:hypothetical protein K8354_04595 [Polaribacter litorisediminis]|uniref:hypothetical protein n=1 Tax=Polaribacter litorisediminis TaxID=1908341 RepID=UPI001CBB391D|nr:hypothetical protein [Polaribacter litorisediminis]UAM99109.1 hypothetical protein K8354_04595 [Polaribacter litorisediminis]
MIAYIEIGIIVAIIAFQVNLARKLWYKIIEYRAIFDFETLPIISQKRVLKSFYASGNVEDMLSYEEEDGEGDVSITYLDYKRNSKVLGTIVKYINVYLIKNKGASIDFHLIKDIVDKHTETIENQIENRIPAPLYLGLAATMIGIIAGLFSVSFDSGSNALDSIQPLINGVKWAMSASVIGLIITTYFSIKVYKDAQTEADEEKSEFLSKLQSELMPKMATGKLPEVAILSGKLDVFARNTSASINQLDTIVRATSNTIKREHQLISDIKKLDVSRITTSNVKVFNQLDTMMDSFSNFANYYNQLNNSMSSTSELVKRLQHFTETTENINTVLESIKNNIEASNAATNFFNTHIESFSKYGDAVNEAVVQTESKMANAINDLGKLSLEQFNAFNEAIAGFDSKLTTAFTHSIEVFTKAMDEQVLRTEQAFEKSRPKFEKLDHLDQLEKLNSIDKNLENLQKDLSIVFKNSSQDIIAAIEKINSNKEWPISAPSTVSVPDVLKPIKKTKLELVLIVLKIGAYLTILSYGIQSMLIFFDIIQ